MKSTADIMIKSSGTKWKQIKSHVDRKQPYYSNKNIDLDKSGNNKYNHLEDYDKLMRKQFLPYLNAYNHKCVKQRKKNRMYGTLKKNGKGYRKHHDPVSDYLRHTKRRNERMTIFYLGNKDIRKKYYHVLERKYGKDTSQIRNMENHALIHTAKVWNKDNPYLKITNYATNTDESTAHIHTRMVVTGLYGKPRDMATAKEKRKGVHHFVRKPSMSFNKALTATYPHAVNSHGRVDNREAMKQMRRTFDPVIIQSFNRELAKNNIRLRLSLDRTGKANKFSLKEYQAKKDMKKPYQKLARQIKSVTDLKGSVTDKDYYNLATGHEQVDFDNGSKASGADILSVVVRQSLADQKSNIMSHYRSEAVSEAQPVIYRQTAENTSEAQKSASESASLSASSSASSAVSKAKSAISATASKSASDSRAISNAWVNIHSREHQDNINHDKKIEFIGQMLILAMPKTARKLTYDDKKNHTHKLWGLASGKLAVNIDGKKRSGFDLMVHEVGYDLFHKKYGSNMIEIENAIRDYDKNTKKNKPQDKKVPPTKGGKGIQP